MSRGRTGIRVEALPIAAPIATPPQTRRDLGDCVEPLAFLKEASTAKR